MSWFKRKQPVKLVFLTSHMRDHTHCDAEITWLGNKLDHLDAMLKLCTRKERKTWKYNHWKKQRDILFRKWRKDITLRDAEMKETVNLANKYKITYDWWEPSYEVLGNVEFFLYDIFKDFWVKVWGNPKLEAALNESFHKNKEERLRRGQ